MLVSAFFLAAQWYLARTFKVRINKQYAPKYALRIRKTGIALLLLANLVFFTRYITIELGFYEHALIQNLVIYPGGILFAALGLSLVIALSVDAFRLMKWSSAKLSIFFNRRHDLKMPADQNGGDGRREFIKKAGLALAATSPFGVAIGTATATSRDYQVIKKDLFFDNLPAGLEGLKIAQISDIHSGIYMTQGQIQEIFEITNSLHPNLVTITGDFVDTSNHEIPALYNTVKSLKSDFGTFGCLGNHDHYAHGPAVSSALEQQGVNMLVNKNTVLEINGERLTIIGVDDAGSGSLNRARFDKALLNAGQDTFKVLLTHRPQLFDASRHRDINLTLSGHTHGGQIGMHLFGVPLYPIKLLHTYTDGLYQQGDKKLYVNVGVGMVGIPIRSIKPEITLLTLRSTGISGHPVG
ncbi:MAG: metallophosphoesterase [Balneolales bacterium]